MYIPVMLGQSSGTPRVKPRSLQSIVQWPLFVLSPKFGLEKDFSINTTREWSFTVDSVWRNMVIENFASVQYRWAWRMCIYHRWWSVPPGLCIMNGLYLQHFILLLNSMSLNSWQEMQFKGGGKAYRKTTNVVFVQNVFLQAKRAWGKIISRWQRIWELGGQLEAAYRHYLLLQICITSWTSRVQNSIFNYEGNIAHYSLSSLPF